MAGTAELLADGAQDAALELVDGVGLHAELGRDSLRGRALDGEAAERGGRVRGEAAGVEDPGEGERPGAEPKGVRLVRTGRRRRPLRCELADERLVALARLLAADREVADDASQVGAEAAAAAVFLAKTKAGMNEIKAYITAHYYPIDFTLDQIRPTYKFDVSCQGSVPQALEAFFESTSYEDAIRSAVSIGGDSDTIACIAGGIAEAYWGVPESLRAEAMRFLDRGQKSLLSAFEKQFPSPPLKEERS